MPKTQTCGATLDLADDRTLVCDQPADGHDPEVHTDGDHVWSTVG